MMDISSISTSLRAVSPLSRPPPLAKLGGRGFNLPCGLSSPKSPRGEVQRNGRMVMAAASAASSYSTRKNEEREEIAGKRSHYAVLGVACDAGQEEIRAAYRRLALQYHPDVVPMHQLDNATKLFSEINGAYQTLSDPHQRKAYDDLNLLPLKAQKGRAAGFSSYPYSSPSSPREGQSRGRNWETDQCWC